MNPHQARALIEQELASNVLYNFVNNGLVAWPNVPFTPPTDAIPAIGLPVPMWVKVDLVWGDGFLLTKDGRTSGVNRVNGLLQLGYYGAVDVGDGLLYDLVMLHRPWLNRRQLWLDTDTVRFGACAGPRASFEEPWRVLTMTTPYSFLETVTI